ncbi:CHAT domain-containing protein, partial [Candidatus Methylobacter favarea]|uniref:CHAT domain-containing protein n=1 Tax=Candidatus Methylobacter favarea TaxID=2707345 RepID=UPI00157C82D5
MRVNQTSFSAIVIGLSLLLIYRPGLALAVSAQPEKPSPISKAPLRRQLDKLDKSDFRALTRNAQTGLDYFKSGELDLAREKFEASIRQARQSGNSIALASALTNLGNVKSALEQFDGAKIDYLESAKVAAENRLHNIAARAYANAARNEVIQGHRESAVALLHSVYEQIKPLAETREKAELLLGIGHLLQPSGFEKTQIKPASEWSYQALIEGIKSAENLSLDDLRAYGYGYLGALYLNQSRLAEALELTGRAEFVAQSISRPDILFRWQWQTGRILAKQGARVEAIAAYRRAVATLQPIRGELRTSTVTPNLSSSIDDLYVELADLMLQGQKLSEAELLAVRDVIEHGKAEELEDYYHDDCVAAWLGKASRIDHLADRTAALYPIMLPDRLELLLSLPNGLQRYTVYRNRADVRKMVEQLRVTLENRSTPEFLPHAQALYDWLIKPVLADLVKNRIETLVFVPDASLRTIPLAALHDGKDFLVRRYAVATSPGLTLTDPHPIQRENTRALLAGLSEGSQGFQALPNVRDEIRRIAEQFPATVLEDQSFRVSNMSRQLLENPYRIVHIASHGQFNRNIADT